MWPFCKTKKTSISDKKTAKRIEEAVDEQMQKYWTSVSGTAFDSEGSLNAKQMRLDKIAAWADTQPNPLHRHAYKEWVGVAQYTIDEERKDRRKTSRALRLIEQELPEVPF